MNFRAWVVAGALCCSGLAGAADQEENVPAREVGDPEATVPVLLRRSPHIKPRATTLGEELRTPDDLGKSWWDWQRASGDWGGARPAIERHGVIPEMFYTVELFSNVAGGRERGTHAAGLLDVSLTLDSRGLGLWEGGSLFVLFQHQDGRGVSRELGSVSHVGLFDFFSFNQLSAYYVQQNFFEHRLAVRFGKSDANVGFLDSVLTEQFLNGDISPPLNVPMPTYPNPGLGIALFADPTPWLTLGAAAFGADLDGRSFGDGGLFEGKVFAIGEVTLNPRLFGNAGAFNAGAWLSTGETEEVPAVPNSGAFDRNWGAYVLLDSVAFREAGQPDQGLGLWFQLSWAPPDRNPADLWVGGGLVYAGPVPSRDDDVLGFAVTSAGLTQTKSGTLPTGSELFIEWFYEIAFFPWFSLKPDIQYAIDPGGENPNGLVLGVQTSLAF